MRKADIPDDVEKELSGFVRIPHILYTIFYRSRK
jgi:hypothetical protein